MRIGIIGTGVAGPTLAYWLRHYGHEPVLFEQAPRLRTGGYIIDFWGLGYDIAERMGVLPEVRSAGYDVGKLRLVDRRGRTATQLDVGRMRAALDGRLTSVARADLAAALYGACDGIETRFGCSPEAIEQDDSGVDVTFDDGTRDRFDLLIGADGLHSRVRELVFPGDHEVSVQCGVAAYRIRGYPHRDELTYVMHSEPWHQIARFSLRDDETLVLLVWRTRHSDDHPPHDAPIPWLHERFSDLGWETAELLAAMDDADDLYVDRVSQIKLDRWSQGRVGLLGDAAACASLLAGEGTGLAMTEAFVLAGELHRTTDPAAAFAAYEDRLRGFVTAKQEGAVGFRGFFVPASPFWRWARDRMVDLMSVPLVGPWLMSRELRDDLELPAYE